MFVCMQSSKEHMTVAVLEAFLELTQYLVKLPTGAVLLKHLFDYILFNPQLWVHTSVEVGTVWVQHCFSDYCSGKGYGKKVCVVLSQ